MRLRLASIALSALALVFATVASATSVRPMTVQEIATLSGHVVWATVESIAPRWADGHHEIESVVRLVSVEYVKGEGPESVDLVMPGGTLDGFTMKIEGAPELHAGERWMLFLLPEWRTHPCVGIWQGAFQEVPTPQGRVVVGTGGLVTGLGANGHVKFGAATDRGLTAAQWNEIVAPMCAAARSEATATKTTPTTLGTRVWTSHTATPMRDADGRPLNAPARRADPSARRPSTPPLVAQPRPRGTEQGTGK